MSSPDQHHKTIWLMVIASTFFWGSNFNAGHAVASDTTPLTAAAERFAFALVLFWAMRWLFGKAESQLHLPDYFLLVILGLVGVFGFNYAFFTAMHTTSALNAALIMGLSPMLSVILSSLLLHTAIKRYQYAGILLAFLGVCLVVTDGNFHLIRIVSGDLWMLLACSVWSLYSVLSKKYISHIPPIQSARWTVSIGSIGLMIIAILFENPLTSLAQTSFQSHLILSYMGIFGSVLAYIYWLRGVYILGPDKSAVAFNLVPVFTLLVSLVLGDIPSMTQLLGLLLILAGVWIVLVIPAKT